SIFASATQFSLVRPALEDEAARAGCVGECLDTSVIHEAAAIEHDLLDAARLGLLGQQLADRLGGGHVATRAPLGAEILAPGVHRDEGASGVVVHQLGTDVLDGPEHGQARPLGRATHPTTQTVMTDVARCPPVLNDHFAPAFLPTLRRITSS